tara:strand:- start:551 stop:850 length:300 start_codon:yes stop_codon:yes gene_type:complete
VKLPKIIPQPPFGSEQVCNYYLARLQRLYLDNELFEYANFQEAEEKLSLLLMIAIAESQEDLLYLPYKIIEVKSIVDVLYYEGIYGKEIYQKENYKQEK